MLMISQPHNSLYRSSDLYVHAALSKSQKCSSSIHTLMRAILSLDVLRGFFPPPLLCSLCSRLLSGVQVAAMFRCGKT